MLFVPIGKIFILFCFSYYFPFCGCLFYLLNLFSIGSFRSDLAIKHVSTEEKPSRTTGKITLKNIIIIIIIILILIILIAQQLANAGMIQLPLISTQDSPGVSFGLASISNDYGVFRSNEFGEYSDFSQRETDLR